MKTIFWAIADLIIYSSFLISAGALLLCLESFLILGMELHLPYLLLVFFSCLLIYALHRIIGIRMIAPLENNNRFGIILKYRHHLLVYALISFMACMVLLFYIQWAYITALIPAGLLAGLYVIPLMRGKRLRDFHYIKVFIIAAVWSYVSLWVPVLAEGRAITPDIILYGTERFLFILAITLPFDVRDIAIDQQQGVNTLASLYGEERCYRISIVLLVMGYVLFVATTIIGNLGVHLLSITGAYLLTLFLLWLSRGRQSDYFFSGLLDGSILLRSLIITAWFLVGHLN